MMRLVEMKPTRAAQMGSFPVAARAVSHGPRLDLQSRMAIGVFDSGLGGLTVLAALAARLPRERFVYLGDSAHAPYGTRPPEEILRLTLAGVERLFDAGCGLVVLACNTASAVSLRRIQETWLPQNRPERRVLGVFVPVIEAVTGRPWGFRGPPGPARLSRIGFFGTPATVASGAFSRELALRATGIEVTETPCPGLVERIERGELKAAETLVADRVESFLTRSPTPEAAVLGCTHYPLVEPAFRAALPPGTSILSQPLIVAESLADYLSRHPRFGARATGVTPGVEAMTTGDPRAVTRCAGLFPGLPLVFRAA